MDHAEELTYNYIKQLICMDFYIEFHEKPYPKGKYYHQIIDDYWNFDPDIESWNYNVKINNFQIDNVIESYKSINYKKYLSSLRGEYLKDLNEKMKHFDNKGDYLNHVNDQLDLIKNIKINYYMSDEKNDDLYDFEFYIKLTKNSLVNITSNDINKYQPNDDFNLLIISLILSQQLIFIDDAIEILQNRIVWISKLDDNYFNAESQSKKVSSNLSWKKSDTDLLELIVALNESGSIFSNNSAMTRKQTIELFEDLFGITIKDPESKLSRATERKKDPAPYLSSLKQTFENYSKKKFE
jgi:hypothetical protein